MTSCSSITIKRENITRGIPEEIKIIQVSDLHLNKEKKIYRKLLEIINNAKPDILLITDDSVDNKENIYLLDNFLKQIDSSINIYAVPGNWEHWCEVNLYDLRTVYYENGVQLFINEGADVTVNNQRIYIFGTDDLIGGNPDISRIRIDTDKINIIMTHSPAYFDSLTKTLKDDKIFVFSGHTHGGQITFFGKPFFMPQGCGEYLKGIYRKDKITLFVSKGIGNSIYDFRLFAKPGIFLVTIK